MKELEAYLAAPAPTTVLALVGDGVKTTPRSPRPSRRPARSSPTTCEEAASGVGRRAVRAARRDGRPRRLPRACRGGRRRRRRPRVRDPEARDLGERRGDHARGRRGARRRAGRDADLRGHRRLGRRDVGATLRATESLLDRSHRPRSGELIRLVASLVGHVGRVRKIARLADEGVRSSEIATQAEDASVRRGEGGEAGGELLGRTSSRRRPSGSPSSTPARRAAPGCRPSFSSSERSSRSRAGRERA